MSGDHREWALAGPRSLSWIDLTQRAIDFTREHLALEALALELRVADAENLPFDDARFDRESTAGAASCTTGRTRGARFARWRACCGPAASRSGRAITRIR